MDEVAYTKTEKKEQLFGFWYAPPYFSRYFNILPRQNICFWDCLYVVLKTMCYSYSYFVMWFYMMKIYRKNF